MFETVLDFFDRHQSFILTTHDPPDADGIGAEMVLGSILKKKGKDVKIINSSPIPNVLKFLTNPNLLIPGNPDKLITEIEIWDSLKLANEKYRNTLKNYALLILDTSEEIHLGLVREAIYFTKETFIFDHHEIKPSSKLSGFIDSHASSTSELAIELACSMGIEIDQYIATAVYSGLVLDTGFFSYPKTSQRTFKAAIKAMEWGALPNYIYRQLMENSTCAAIFLLRQALDNLKFLANKKIALMCLRTEDYKKAGADFDEVENIVNIPLKAREVEVAILIRERANGEISCSLRSKGSVNVSKIAHEFGGGGHLTAAGFRSKDSIKTITEKLINTVESRLNI